MARSIKKGPYVQFKLTKKLDKMNAGGKKKRNQNMESRFGDHS